jgi:hypothetical protein
LEEAWAAQKPDIGASRLGSGTINATSWSWRLLMPFD